MTRTPLVIEPPRAIRLDVRELWRYRDLFWILTLRDIKVRYKQTLFGAAWAVFQPLLLMLIFTIFLGGLAGVPSEGVPYALFAYVGLVPWTMFSQGVNGAAGSLVENERLVTRVYFPRLLMPLASIASYGLDFVIGHVLVVGLMIQYGAPLRGTVVWVPVLAAAVFVATSSVGVGLAALNVRYRDVRYAIPFLVQVLLFLTPVVYPAGLVSGGWRYVFALNPMVGVVDLYRWAILGTPHLAVGPLLTSGLAALALLGAGIVYFHRVERSFADII